MVLFVRRPTYKGTLRDGTNYMIYYSPLSFYVIKFGPIYLEVKIST
jgi:hypothetical protein